LKDFLKPTCITQAAFARHIGVDPSAIFEIIKGRRGVSSEMAIKFSAAFGDDPQTWRNLQSMHELTLAREQLRNAKRQGKIARLPQFAGAYPKT
jgi:addiction module HigA family antidote